MWNLFVNLQKVNRFFPNLRTKFTRGKWYGQKVFLPLVEVHESF